MNPELKKKLRKRIPAYLLVMSMAALVLHYWQRRPLDIVVNLQVGQKTMRGLRGLKLTYRQQTRVFGQASFSFRNRKVPGKLSHRLQVLRGDYEVDVELLMQPKTTTHARGLPRQAAASQAARGQGKDRTGVPALRTQRLRRLLLARESGPVTIFIDAEEI